MSVQLNCTVCWDSLQEGGLTHIPHTDGTPKNRRHIGEGIHQQCLENWVTGRFALDQPVICPLGCPGKFIDGQLFVPRQESRFNRAVQWIKGTIEPLAAPINRQIILRTAAAGVVSGAVWKTTWMKVLSWLSLGAESEILLSIIYKLSTVASIAVGLTAAHAVARALAGQDGEGLRMRGIENLAKITGAASSILGVAAAYGYFS